MILYNRLYRATIVSRIRSLMTYSINLGVKLLRAGYLDP